MPGAVISALGPSMKTVFRSRWRALWWAAGVLLTTYCVVPAPDEGAPQPTAPQPAAHANPWTKDSTGQ